MRNGSGLAALFVLTSGVAAVACGGSDASPAPAAGDVGVETPAGDAPAAPPAANDDGGSVAQPDPDAGAPDADAAAPVLTPQILGYVYSGSPAAAETTPGANFSYNSAGGAMKITRTNTGSYTVTFKGLDVDHTVALVSAYGTAGGLCSWGISAGENVAVRCYDASSNLADARFTLTIVGKGTTGATILGFAHANDKTSALYDPQASRTNNAIGAGEVSATRTSVGNYSITFDGLSGIGNVQVMPYGDPTAHCVVKSWGGSTVKVGCYDNTGAAMDAQYTVLLAGKNPGGTAKVVAYADANQFTSASYTPSLAHNEGGGAVTALRSAPGTYTIKFEGQNLNTGAHVQVTGHAATNRCNVDAWAGTTINLTCANDQGTLLDNKYAIVVIQ